MADKLKNKLTIAVCSNRIDKLRTYTLPSLKVAKEFCDIKLFLDGSLKEDLNSFFTEIKEIGNIEIVTSNTVNGHSNLRNIVLKSCKTKFLLFLDDDITIDIDSVKRIIEALENDFQIVGLKLAPAEYIQIDKCYISKNQYHYLAIHTEFTLNTIWGACMAFSVEPIKRLNIFFDEKLGRQNNKFLSGEDTSFISYLTKQGCKAKLIKSSSAIHHIDETRLKFLSLMRRVFWQGITEAMRRNIKDGFVKEMKRNFAVVTPQSFFLGGFWLFIFSIGCFYGVFYKMNSIKE